MRIRLADAVRLLRVCLDPPAGLTCFFLCVFAFTDERDRWQTRHTFSVVLGIVWKLLQAFLVGAKLALESVRSELWRKCAVAPIAAQLSKTHKHTCARS